MERSWAASPSQAAAAASIGPDPGPEYIRPELISGGNTAKSIATKLLNWPLLPHSGCSSPTRYPQSHCRG